MPGFINDSTLTNPCDPNSMQNVGNPRNTVYKVKVVKLPDGHKMVKSKVPKDWQNKGPLLNKSFYRFGSQTNIRSAFEVEKAASQIGKKTGSKGRGSSSVVSDRHSTRTGAGQSDRTRASKTMASS